MKLFTREFVLSGITAEDFAAWRHHPVTKVFRRYLQDSERQLMEQQIGEMRNAAEPVSPFRQGEFAGRMNMLAELTELTFEVMASAWPSEAEMKEDNATAEGKDAA